jgi:hypothetical protein
LARTKKKVRLFLEEAFQVQETGDDRCGTHGVSLAGVDSVVKYHDI